MPTVPLGSINIFQMRKKTLSYFHSAFIFCVISYRFLRNVHKYRMRSIPLPLLPAFVLIYTLFCPKFSLSVHFSALMLSNGHFISLCF